MSDVRTTREALLAELLRDVDQILERQERSAAATEAAAARLEAAARAVEAATAAAAEAARTSVGEYITRRVNESTAQALQTTRQAIDEAAAAALGKAMLVAQERSGQASGSPTARPTTSLAWWAFGAGVAAAAIGAGVAWLITR